MSNTTLSTAGLNYFPHQKISSMDKDEDWYMKCIDSAEQAIFNRQDWIRQSMYNKKVNYNLANNILDEEEIHRVFNPLNIQHGEFPASIQHFNKAMNKINLLVGEELKRQFDWKLVCLNPDAISGREQLKKDLLFQLASNELNNPNTDETKLKQNIRNIAKYTTYDYQDVRERVGSNILEYLWHEQRIKYKSNKGFQDLLIAGEEIYRTDIVGGNPVFERVNPLNFFTLRNSDSSFVEDAEICVEITYMPIGKIVEEFYEDLQPDEIDYLESGNYNQYIGGGMLGYMGRTPVWKIPEEALGRTNGYGILEPNANTSRWFGGWFNEHGEVRVVRCRWKSRLKRQKRTYFDEYGFQQEDIVSEYYKPNKELGESCKEIWINEWHEGVKIGPKYYKRTGPRKTQIRNMTNPAKCNSGYVGTYYNINDSRALSLMDRMRPFQYLYNLFWRKLELALARYNGPTEILPFHLKPANWTNDQWLYYKQAIGILAIDPFNEAQSGIAKGTIAGQMNTFLPQIIDSPAFGNYIQQMVQLIDYVDRQIGEISGVTREREGNVHNVETVGGIERSVTQSSHITEPWFYAHEDTMIRALMTLLETAKVAYKDKKNVKLQYILDDLSVKYVEFDGDEFAESEYGLYVVNSGKVQKLQSLYESLAQAGIQNDKINFSQIMEIYNSNSMIDIRRKLEGFEQEKLEQLQSAQEQQNKVQQDIANQNAQLEMQKHEDDINLRQEELQNTMDIELLRIDLEKEKLGISRDNEQLWARIQEQQDRLNNELTKKKLDADREASDRAVKEQERANKVKEAQKEKELSIKKSQVNKKDNTKK